MLNGVTTRFHRRVTERRIGQAAWWAVGARASVEGADVNRLPDSSPTSSASQIRPRHLPSHPFVHLRLADSKCKNGGFMTWLAEISASSSLAHSRGLERRLWPMAWATLQVDLPDGQKAPSRPERLSLGLKGPFLDFGWGQTGRGLLPPHLAAACPRIAWCLAGVELGYQAEMLTPLRPPSTGQEGSHASSLARGAPELVPRRVRCRDTNLAANLLHWPRTHIRWERAFRRTLSRTRESPSIAAPSSEERNRPGGRPLWRYGLVRTAICIVDSDDDGPIQQSPLRRGMRTSLEEGLYPSRS